jgi:hypothetical protein
MIYTFLFIKIGQMLAGINQSSATPTTSESPTYMGYTS